MVAEVGDRVAAVGPGPDVLGVDARVAGVVGVAAGARAADEDQVVGGQPVVVSAVAHGGRAVAVADRGQVRGVAVAAGTQPVDGVGEPLPALGGRALGEHPGAVPALPRPREVVGGVVADPEHGGVALAAVEVARRLVERGGPVGLVGRALRVGAEAGHHHRHVVGGVEVAGGDRHPAVAAERRGVVEVELRHDRLSGDRVVASGDGVAGAVGRAGVVEPGALVVGDDAGVLEQRPLREVAVEGDGVGGVAVLGGDAVEVAHRPGARHHDRQLLLAGQALPPPRDPRGVGAAGGPRGQCGVGRVLLAAVAALHLVEGHHPGEGLVHRLLLGDDVARPGGDVGLERVDLAAHPVAVGLERRRLVGGGRRRLLGEHRDLLAEVLAALGEVDPPLEERLHLPRVGLDAAPDGAQGQRHGVRPVPERPDGRVVGRGPLTVPVADAGPAGDEAAEVVDLRGRRQQLPAALPDRAGIGDQRRHRTRPRREPDRHRRSVR